MHYIIYVLIVCVSCISKVYTVCKPDIVAFNDALAGQTADIECRIRGMTECSTGLTFMSFERKIPNQPIEWQAAFTLSPDKSRNFSSLPYGYDNLDSRVQSTVVNGYYYMTFNPSRIEDSGQWRCKVVGSGGEFISDEGTLSISNSSLDANKIISDREDRNTLMLGINNTYSCSIDRISPATKVFWKIDSTSPLYDNGTSNNSRNEYVWSIHNSIQLIIHDPSNLGVACGIEYDGDIVMGNPTQPGEYLCPGRVENVTTSLTKEDTRTILTLRCIASGNNVITEWKYAGAELPGGFTYQTQNISGNFQYDQKTAVENLAIYETGDDVCSLKNLVGNYTCIAKGMYNTGDEMVVSLPVPCPNTSSGCEWWCILLCCCCGAGVVCGCGFLVYWFGFREDKSDKNNHGKSGSGHSGATS